MQRVFQNGITFRDFPKVPIKRRRRQQSDEAAMTYKDYFFFFFASVFSFRQELAHRARLAFAVFRVTLCDVVGKVGVVKVQVIF